MNKFYIGAGVIATIILGLFLFHKFSAKVGKQEQIIEHEEEKIEDQEHKIEDQHDTIEVKKYQQKIISKTVINSDVVARREFLQFVFTERENPDK